MLPGSADSPDQMAAKRKKLSLGDVFNQDDEATAASKKRKLVPLDYAGSHVHMNEPLKAAVAAAAAVAAVKKPTTAEEKRKCIKNLIEKIPTGKNELFAYGLDWTMVDGVSACFGVSFYRHMFDVTSRLMFGQPRQTRHASVILEIVRF